MTKQVQTTAASSSGQENVSAKTGKAAAARRTGSNSIGFIVLCRKELVDLFDSMRVVLLFALFFIVAAAALNGAVGNLDSQLDGTLDYAFLKLFTTSGTSIYSFVAFIAFLGPLAGIALGFDAVSNEKSQGTLIRLASQPIYRDTIINAKFAAPAFAIFVMIFTLGGFFCGVGVIKTGIRITGEEALRILVFLLVAVIYIWFWLALSVFFSVVCRHTATAAIVPLAIWLFTALFMSLAASGIANMIYPLTGYNAMLNQMKNYELQIGIMRISPYYLFSQAVTAILNPNVRSIGVTSMTQYTNAVASYLTLGQSLLLIWPILVTIVALAAVAFGAAYICFMKQEIRA